MKTGSGCKCGLLSMRPSLMPQRSYRDIYLGECLAYRLGGLQGDRLGELLPALRQQIRGPRQNPRSLLGLERTGKPGLLGDLASPADVTAVALGYSGHQPVGQWGNDVVPGVGSRGHAADADAGLLHVTPDCWYKPATGGPHERSAGSRSPAGSPSKRDVSRELDVSTWTRAYHLGELLCTCTGVGRTFVCVPVTLGQIVSQAELGMVPVSAIDLNGIVRWVTITELPDPSRWLDGGELVLTTGLRQRTASEQAAFVEALCRAKAAALGFGVGLSHHTVPKTIVQTAQANNLPLLVVPYETPFIAVTRFIADRMSHEHASQLQSLLDAHEQLGHALQSGQGLQQLLHVFVQITQAPAAVVDLHGSLLASAPPLASWPIEQIIGLLRDGDAIGSAAVRHLSLDIRPVTVEGRLVAAFCARAPAQAEHIVGDILGYAAQLTGLEMARRQAVLAGRRELAGQVLEDIVRAAISTSEAERRLTAVGVEPYVGHRVVLGIVDANQTAMRNLPWSIHPVTDEKADPVVTALTGRYFAAICTETQPVHDTAHMMSEYLRNLGQGVCVGIGGVYSGVDGLRWSFFEARDALGKGSGIHEGEPLSLPRLLVANPELPVQELARAALRPVLEADGEGNRTLADTLRVFLELDGSVSATAARLFIHRNTVRYRLTQVERLTGRSLASTQDRVHLWLALIALGDPPAVP